MQFYTECLWYLLIKTIKFLMLLASSTQQLYPSSSSITFRNINSFLFLFVHLFFLLLHLNTPNLNLQIEKLPFYIAEKGTICYCNVNYIEVPYFRTNIEN